MKQAKRYKVRSVLLICASLTSRCCIMAIIELFFSTNWSVFQIHSVGAFLQEFWRQTWNVNTPRPVWWILLGWLMCSNNNLRQATFRVSEELSKFFILFNIMSYEHPLKTYQNYLASLKKNSSLSELIGGHILLSRYQKIWPLYHFCVIW